MFRFEKLEVWQKAIVLAAQIYEATRDFPDDERFGLQSQMRRAGVSISANIAEGSSRTSNRDFARFIEIAYGSLMETISHLYIAQQQNLFQEQKVAEIRELAEEISRMLSGLRRSLLKDQ